ncbi:MAG TPA: hypothetical protein VHZ74_03240 [Bryobacteraceae bacterium]|nr:hypothetical protein [Bryobacteraceae bacterium]
MLFPLETKSEVAASGSAVAICEPIAGVPQSAASASSAGASSEVPAIARFLPSLTDLAFLMPLIFIFLKLSGARTLLGDGDTGWHVRTGEWILAHHQVPHIDIFSFSRPGAPWFAWEWLWDALFAMVHQRFGLAGVVLASIIVICFTSIGLFRLIRRTCNNSLVAIAVTLLATGGCAIHWLARPHLFTLLFLVVTLHITNRAAEGRTKLLAWMVPLTLLWTNLHGGFFIVFLIFACYIGSDLLNAAIEPGAERRRQFLRSTKPWLATSLGCLAVTFINPYGWELHKHVIGYITDPYQLQHISEFQSMNFHAPVVVYFEPLMFLALLTALWDARNRRFADVFMSLGWLHLSLIAQRNVPIFAIAAAPLVARAVVAAIDAGRNSGFAAWVGRASSWFETSSASFEETDRLWRVHIVSVLPVLLAAALLLAPKPMSAKFTSTYDPTFYPEAALPLLLSPETHHIFAEDEWGDYLIYHLYPTKKVFVDGRSDFYGDEFGERYLDVMNVKPGWQKTLDKYAIDTIAISPKFALTSTLKISREWRVVYDDTVTVVFRRAASDHSRLPVSLISSNEGKIRDHAITNTTNDRKITQHTTPPTT